MIASQPSQRSKMGKTMFIDIALPATPPARAAEGGKHLVIRKRGARLPPPGRNVLDTPELQELFQNVYDAGLITDPEGNIVDANERAVLFFEYSRPQLKGSHVSQVIPGMNTQVLNTLLQNLENNQFTLLQGSCLRQDDTSFPAEISTSSLRLNETDYLCFFIRDITERRRAEEQLQQAHDRLSHEVQERARINLELQGAIVRLEEHNQAKSEFISNVSHEFRTPVTSIRYMAGNLLRGVTGPLGTDTARYLEMIVEDCDRLTRTVEDILDLSRIDNESLTLEVVKMPWSRLVRRICATLRVQAEVKSIELAAHLPDGLGFIACDVQKIERVVLNVIKNALKFTPEGGRVEVVLEPSEAYPAYMALHVTDNGIGIPPEHLPRVTERYYRVGEQVSGTGLGLALSKEMMGRHNGVLEIVSPPPDRAHGTRVSLYLPRVDPPSVLLVADAPGVTGVVTPALLEHAYTMQALAPDHASQALPDFSPDAICMDWSGPGMAPVALLPRLASHPAFAYSPIVVLTEAEPAPMKLEILEGFRVRVLEAPWPAEKLLDCLENALKYEVRKDTAEGVTE